MKIYLECYECLMRQAIQAIQWMGLDEEGQYEGVMRQIFEKLSQNGTDCTTPEMAYHIQEIIRQASGQPDPYLAEKEKATQQALALYPPLKGLVEQADDPLEMAIRLSIAGNIIDLGTGRSYDLEESIERVLSQPFAIEAFEPFREALARVDWILYLGDNAGETVFDRLLIEVLEPPVTYVTRGGPVLNDATRREAIAAGLDQVATLVDNGHNVAGTLLHHCSPEFRRLFEEAELIIVKGQGNFETLSDTKAPMFFLLQTKCDVVSRHLGTPLKSIIFKQQEL